MAFYPSYSFRRNLEPVAAEIEAGSWRIGSLVDLVSEKRYLLFKLKSRASADVLPSVLGFRSECAVAIAGEACPPALSFTIEGDRIEFLVDHVDLGPIALALLKRGIPAETELTTGGEQPVPARIDPESLPPADQPGAGRRAVERLRAAPTD